MSLSKPSRDECIPGTSKDDDEVGDNGACKILDISLASRTEKGMWDYFKKKEKNSTSAECTLCSAMYKISQRSTKGLKVHLKAKHGIELGDHTKNREDDIEPVPKKKIKTIDSFFIKKNPVGEIVATLVSQDGLPLSVFCTSSKLRHVFDLAGLKLPNSPNTIRSMVSSFANTVKADMIIEFEHLKKQGKRFSLVFDEWTSQKNHRYLNVNVHLNQVHYNLGLIRIHGSGTAEHCVSLIRERLAGFGLDLDTDIIAITTDGASVMVKVGKLLPCWQQLCFAHGLQLVVIDTLYKRNNDPISELAAPAASTITEPTNGTEAEFDYDDYLHQCNDNSNIDSDMTYDTIPLEQGVIITRDLPPAQIVSSYDDLLKKVRKVVMMFKRSPTKYDLYLQKYVKEETGKELALIMDCRTRWSSLFTMIERFYRLKNCINKALIDVGSDTSINDKEWSMIHDLLTCLQPFKLGVEALCRQESTLITSDTTFRFILEQLELQDTVLSNKLSTVLRERIQERRTDLTGLLIYLQNPKKYEQEVKKPDRTFPVPKKTAIRQEIVNILERVLVDNSKNDSTQAEIMEIEAETEMTSPAELTLKQQLEIQLKGEKEIFKKKTDDKKKDYEKILKREMLHFETDGVRGHYLSLAYEHISSVKPTSVESERAFSAAGYICSSLRSRLADETIDMICFLRAHGQRVTKLAQQPNLPSV